MSYSPVELVKLSADSVLKICKTYANKNNSSVEKAILVLFETYPDDIKEILLNRLNFYYKLNKNNFLKR